MTTLQSSIPVAVSSSYGSDSQRQPLQLCISDTVHVFAMQMFVEVLKALAGDVKLPSSPYTPWRFGDPLQLLQDLKAANFSNVECTPYSHDMTWTLPDLIQFQVGPFGQSRPSLERLKALGRDNVDEEAPKVECGSSELGTSLCCKDCEQGARTIH